MLSEKLNISSRTTIETHIWTCAPLKHEGYEPTDSIELIDGVKSSIFHRKTTIETQIWTCAPPLKHEGYEPTDSF